MMLGVSIYMFTKKIHIAPITTFLLFNIVTFVHFNISMMYFFISYTMIALITSIITKMCYFWITKKQTHKKIEKI